MTHPYLRVLVKSFKQWICSVDGFQIGTTILTRVGLFNLATKCVRNELCTIADAQHRHLTNKLREVNLKCLWVVNRIRRTAKDDTDDIGIVVLRILVVRQNLTEGVEFTHPAANELRGLRTEI